MYESSSQPNIQICIDVHTIPTVRARMGGEWTPLASPGSARHRGLEARLRGRGLRGDRAEPDLTEPSRTQVVNLLLKKVIE
jgi:hypothetical protein